MMKRLVILFILILFIPGCASFMKSVRKNAVSADWDVAVAQLSSSKLGEISSSNEARIVFTRESSWVGAAVPHCVMDTGSDIEKNVYVFQKKLVADQFDDFDIRSNLLTVTQDQYGFIQYKYNVKRIINSGGVVIREKYDLLTMDLQELILRAIVRSVINKKYNSATIPEATEAIAEKFNAKKAEAEYFITEEEDISWDDEQWMLLTVYDWTEDVHFNIKGYNEKLQEIVSINILAAKNDVADAIAMGEGVFVRMADIIDDVNSGETISWDRPPGTMRLEVFTPGGDQAFMAPLEVKEGFIYRVSYDYGSSGVSFNVSEEEM